MDLTNELKSFLHNQGAALVGIGDLRDADGSAWPIGVSVAVPLPKKVIADLHTAPTEEYYHLYHSLNHQLNEIVLAGEAFLKQKGCDAWAQSTQRVHINDQHVSPLPHKTVAVQAGLGWIGRNCLLVTPEYGSAIRLSSLLTNAPLICDTPIHESRCGACRLCVQHCPAQALTGALWQPGMNRTELLDAEKCYQKQLEIMENATGIRTDLCGKCFAVCPYTNSL